MRRSLAMTYPRDLRSPPEGQVPAMSWKMLRRLENAASISDAYLVDGSKYPQWVSSDLDVSWQILRYPCTPWLSHIESLSPKALHGHHKTFTNLKSVTRHVGLCKGEIGIKMGTKPALLILAGYETMSWPHPIPASSWNYLRFWTLLITFCLKWLNKRRMSQYCMRCCSPEVSREG